MGTFADQQSISTYWFNKSNETRNAAACVWNSLEESQKTTIGEESFGPPSRSVYFMLCGMSLEAMFKAIIIEHNHQPPKSHDLPSLARSANLAFDAHETDLLEILSAAIVWDGRYPVPLKEKAWNRLIELEGSNLFDSTPLGRSSELMMATPNDELNWESYSVLWERACIELISIAKWVTRR